MAGTSEAFIPDEAVRFPMRRLQATIMEAFPNAFRMPRAVTDPNSPLIYSGSLLQLSDIHMLPVQKKEVTKKSEGGHTLYGVFGSYAVIQSVIVLPPDESYKFLWTPTREFLVWVGSVSAKDDLDTLLAVFERTGFGAARLSGRQIRTLITLDDVVTLVREGRLVSDLRLDEISSEPMTVPGDVPLVDALQMMFKARVRRLFLDEDQERFVSDRSALSLLFSPFMLKLARDTPEKWLRLAVKDLPRRRASLIDPKSSLDAAARHIGHWPDDCLLVGGKKVVTRWDIVMKPWKKGFEYSEQGLTEIVVEPGMRNRAERSGALEPP
jgi:hypothetical protein